MNQSLRGAALAVLMGLPLFAGASQSSIDLGPTGKAPPPNDPLLAPFLRVPTYASRVLSPDGKHIAAVGFNASGVNSEGHGLSRAANIRIYYAAVFKLLERTIGKGESPFPTVAPGSAAKEIPLTPIDGIDNP